MRYRPIPRSKKRAGEIGVGMGKIHESGYKETVKALVTAVEGGVNYFDLCCGDLQSYGAFKEAIAGGEDEVFVQTHLGCAYPNGEYAHIHAVDEIRTAFEQMLTELGVGYVDCAMFHCIDEMEEYEQIMTVGDRFDYARDLKKQGVIGHLGLSTHTPAIAEKFLDSAEIDVIMFSINPAYDYTKGEWSGGSHEERLALYRRCEREQVAISVMKPFAAGQLLDPATSPLNITLSREQCLRYALDRPAVVTCLPGITDSDDVKALLAYEDADAAATDYSIIATAAPAEAKGRCVYCNHCAPCPVGINIGLVNKYYDLAAVGDDLAADHYRQLNLTAADCESCGHCDDNCPFAVAQSERMAKIAAYFRK